VLSRAVSEVSEAHGVRHQRTTFAVGVHLVRHVDAADVLHVRRPGTGQPSCMSG